ncbi:MAG: proteasome subunit beta, partial [Halobacteriales archaeon]
MRSPTDAPFRDGLERPGDVGGNPYEPELGDIPRNDLSQEDLEGVNKTGTTTVGVSTADGVVLATDMRASLGGRFVSNKDVQKVEQIHP